MSKGRSLANSNITEAGVNYKKAAEINPYNDLALMSYGVCFARKGNLQEGIKWVEKAVQVNPRNEGAKKKPGSDETGFGKSVENKKKFKKNPTKMVRKSIS